MRKVVVLILMLSFAGVSEANAQWVSDKDRSATKEFFRDFRKSHENFSGSDIMVITSPDWQLIDKLNWDNVITNYDYLDRKVVLKIRKKIEISKRFKWTAGILGPFKPTTWKEIDQLAQKLNNDEFWRVFPIGYHAFSLPIFFKDYTMCIFYLRGHGHGYEEQGVYIYRKEQTGWKELKCIYAEYT